MTRLLWKTAGASVLGASHRRRDLPNQDAWLAEPGLDGGAGFLIAVADGHGSPRHHRSDVGAQLAVQALRDVLAWFFDDPDSLPELAEDLHALWLQSVREDLARNPCDEGVIAYGSTLVAVAARGNHLLALQLGDGDLLLGYADGAIVRPFEDDDLVGEETYSLCMDNAARFVKRRLFSRVQAARWPDFAFVSTDGVSKSFVDGEAFMSVVANYRDLSAEGNSLKSTVEALPGWLREVTDNGSGDDATLCIATCR